MSERHGMSLVLHFLKKIYPSKLLLFGEYLLLYGGDALAYPFEGQSGRWVWHPNKGRHEGQKNLWEFAQSNVSKKILHEGAEHFQADVIAGLYFESSIPTGYGAGSSGALTAAVYERYCPTPKEDLADLKKELAALEGFFHGNSSGIDPLTSYTRAPIFLKNGALQKLEQQSLSVGGFHPYLLDTGQPRSTQPLVQWFKSEVQNPDFQYFIQHEMLPLSNFTLSNFLLQKADFLLGLKELSLYQWSFLKKLIPERYRAEWKKGLDNDTFYLKLCGAGGGGYLLLWVREGEEEYLPDDWLLRRI